MPVGQRPFATQPALGSVPRRYTQVVIGIGCTAKRLNNAAQGSRGAATLGWRFGAYKRTTKRFHRGLYDPVGIILGFFGPQTGVTLRGYAASLTPGSVVRRLRRKTIVSVCCAQAILVCNNEGFCAARTQKSPAASQDLGSGGIETQLNETATHARPRAVLPWLLLTSACLRATFSPACSLQFPVRSHQHEFLPPRSSLLPALCNTPSKGGAKSKSLLPCTTDFPPKASVQPRDDATPMRCVA